MLLVVSGRIIDTSGVPNRRTIMEILKLTPTNHADVVATAAEILTRGGLVIFPTETVYGAGVDATNQDAVTKLLAYKSRREGKPLSIAVTSQEMASQFVELNQQAENLYQRFLPGPVTVVSKARTGKLATGVASEFGTLGVRIPAFELVLQLVSALGNPITATSANGSGKKRPYTVDDILSQLSDKQKSLIDLVIDAGALPPNPPSTVIDTTLSTPVTLRQGSIELATPGDADLTLESATESETKAIAGRLLLQHWDQIQKDGLLITLDGPLGAGKTIFTKGVAEFLNISDEVTSPTYTYLEEYAWQRHQTNGMLYHLDLWKVDSAEQLKLLDIPPLFKPNSIVVIEWWHQVAAFSEEALGQLPPRLAVTIDQPSTNLEQRTLTIHQPKT